MTVQLNKSEMQHAIAERVAQELAGPCIVNLGIGIPTLVAEYMTEDNIYLHTENGLLGVTDVDDEDADPNWFNTGKIPAGEAVGVTLFNTSDSFAMIRGGHVDVAILGALQTDENGVIANWAVPGKNIMGVGGAMDLLVGAKKVFVTMSHTSKGGSSKLLKKCTYPITSTRQVDMIFTELAVFKVTDGQLKLVDLMPGVTIEEVREKTEAAFTEYKERGFIRMKIHSFDVYIVDLPTIRPHQLAMHTIVSQTILLGCVTDKDGREGWAEVATIGGASYGESTPEAIKANIDAYITPLVLGQ